MKSIKAKTKAKKPNGKFGKVKFPSTEVTSGNSDLSQLSQPINTSVSNLYRASKILESGSEEIKSILTYECDLVYECRICRSLFRSLVNFISHKRIYCKEKFDVTFAKNSFNDHDIIFKSNSNNETPEMLLQEVRGNDRILRSQANKEEQKKDLTSIVNMLQKKQTENLQNNTKWVYLETVQSNSSAVYQTVESEVSNQTHADLMKAQVTELKDMINGQTAVLDSNGQLVQPIQELSSNDITEATYKEGSDKILENDITCPICNAKFSTKKTLAVHTRTLHTSHRLCYPCPYCSSTFANTWSVYRHLFKVHRKSNEQVRKLRPQIQDKAFIRDTTVAEDLQKEDANKNLMNDALLVNETQEWMDHLESDTELQRCGGCGKRFDRKAALSAHSQYCHRRVAAYESTVRVKKTSKVSPEPTLKENIVTNPEIQKNADDSSVPIEINNSNETAIRVEAVASLSKADWDKLEAEKSDSQNESNETVVPVVTNGIQETAEKGNLPSANNTTDPIEIVYTNISKQKTNIGSKKRKNKDGPKKLNNSTTNVTKNISLDINIERETEIKKVDRMLLMEKKVALIINLQKLQCLSCKRKFMSVTNLRKHAAIHIGWNRYQCKLCDFKCFVKCDCVAHCNKMHNAQNNRVIIEDMITPIPDDQHVPNQGIAVEIATPVKESGTPEVIVERVEPRAELHVEPCVEPRIEPRVEPQVEPRVEPQVESEVQMEEQKTVNETEAEVIHVSPPPQEIIHVNGETEEALNINVKEQNTLGLDPDVRKMVMEVIFGSSEDSKKTETKGTTFVENSNSKGQNKNDGETQSSCSDTKEGDNMSVPDNLKPQRPIRNKMKPLNKDFIYDLKDVTRKDALIMKPFTKTLSKKSLTPDEDNLDRDTEQLPKRFKSIQNAKISILCENSVMDKCDIKLNRDLKSSLTFPQCHS